MCQAIYKSMFLLLLLVLTACRASELKPVDLESSDSCAFCKMAMSGREFAAEFVAADVGALKFDDIGCSQAYLRENQGKLKPTVFVNDFEAKTWLNARDAWFVKSDGIKTPMGGGIIAFRTREKAELAASRFAGRILRFDEIYGSGAK